MRTSALLGAKYFLFFKIYGVSAWTRRGRVEPVQTFCEQKGRGVEPVRAFCEQEGRGSIFCDFVKTYGTL